MAPSFGNKPKSHEGNDVRRRGAYRGTFRGRGKARGGAKRENTFYSTRVEGQTGDLPGNDVESSADGSEGSDGPSVFSESLGASDNEDTPKDIVKPYSTLLLSLSTDRGEPQPKKRKVETAEVFFEPEISEADVDQVEELEEVEDFGADDVEDVEDVDDLQDDYDPFQKHFAQREGMELSQAIHDVKNDNWATKMSESKIEVGYLMRVPQVSSSALVQGSSIVLDIDNLRLKQKLQSPARKESLSFDKVTGTLTSSIFNYRDVLFPQRTLRNAGTLRKLACLHALNHVFTTRDKVIKDNARLAKEDTENLEFRDQGFTRPKVLVILPTRNSCAKYVDTIISFYEPEQQENRKRFQDSYTLGNDNFSEDKPEDFRELFAGNDDDMFRLGLKFTRKTIKLFAQFYNSDIIFASPLGLRMAIEAGDTKKQDYDFLSSIEIVVVDQADAILMQNWEHMEYIFEHLNLQPKEAHGCDFSRVRNWYLDGNAKYLRQTIFYASFNFPSLNRVFSRHMLNITGKMRYSKEDDGVMIDIGVPTRQTFSRLDATSPVTEPDDRFKHFTTAIVPALIKNSKYRVSAGQGCLVFLPSYADFLRIRNYLASSSDTQDISFGSISEYTTPRDVARARSHFFSGRHSVLLYTERAHHFRRYRLRGVKKIIMYGLPENPIFYKEVVGGYLDSSITSAKVHARETSVRTLFSRFDALKLERIVGTGRLLPMIKEKGGDTFDFV